MLKLPKQLKKKKKSKKSKRKDEELFTEEELEKYKQDQQKKLEEQGGSSQIEENEEWSKFKSLTTGVDSVLIKTQGDLNRIKSTSFFQRVPSRVKEVDSSGKEITRKEPEEKKPVFEISLPELQTKETSEDEGEKSDYGITDDESEEDNQDDIFDTSYVEAVERGEVKLAYVPDSPEELVDDNIFDTSYVESIIKGQESNKVNKSKKALDIGVAVEVLTGRIDNVTITTAKRKRVIPGDLLFDDPEAIPFDGIKKVEEPQTFSLLDDASELPITEPIDLSKSLHTVFLPPKQLEELKEDKASSQYLDENVEEDDEFAQLAAESLVHSSEPIIIKEDLKLEPVLQDSWSVFEADNKEGVFAESVVEDELGLETYIQESDPFDTTFADGVVPTVDKISKFPIDELEDDDFDPRAGEPVTLNNRRKSTVHIHLTNPSGLRESITSNDSQTVEENQKDLLSGSCSDISKISDEPLNPEESVDFIDPFDTTLVDKIVAPGKTELKFLEQELINSNSICRSPSDPDFDPRADEPKVIERKQSRPENLFVNKTVVFDLNGSNLEAHESNSNKKPLTPFYRKGILITEEESEGEDTQKNTLTRTQSNQDLQNSQIFSAKRRHSEFPRSTQDLSGQSNLDLLSSDQILLDAKVLTPVPDQEKKIEDIDPFDTSFTGEIVPSRTELKLLTKEFSEDLENPSAEKRDDLLAEPDDDLLHRKALTPQQASIEEVEDFDPFDTSFTGALQPGKSELKLLESELLN